MAFVRDRFTWLAYFLLAYFAYLEASLGPVMPFVRGELDLNYTITGLHFSAFALGLVLAGALAERLARRWSRRALMWGGAAGMALGVLLLVSSRQVALSLPAVFVMGFLGSLVMIAGQSALSDRHGAQRATALSEANVATIICASLVPLVVGLLERAGYGWRGALLLPVLALILLALLYRNTPVPHARETGAAGKATRARLPGLFWAYAVVIFLSVAAEWCLLFWSPAFLEQVTGFSTVGAATATSVFLGAMVLGRIAGSRATRYRQTNQLLLLALVVALGGFFLFWRAGSSLLTLVGLFVAGLGISNLFPLTLAAGIGAAEQQADLASARLTLVVGLAILLMPLALGGVADQVGIERAFVIVAAVLVLATGVTLLVRRVSVRQVVSAAS